MWIILSSGKFPCSFGQIVFKNDIPETFCREWLLANVNNECINTLIFAMNTIRQELLVSDLGFATYNRHFNKLCILIYLFSFAINTNRQTATKTITVTLRLKHKC